MSRKLKEHFNGGFPLVFLTAGTGMGREKERENQFPLFWLERGRKDIL